MDHSQLERLRFRRQYILAPSAFECPFLCNKRKVTNHYLLYTHIDLPVSEYTEKDLKLILLGDMFDYENAQKENEDILRDLADQKFDGFVDVYSKYSGRYVLIYIQKDQIYLFHDATAARKIFYCSQNDGLWFGSQPHLLAKILDLKRTADPTKLSFYSSKAFTWLNNSNVGDTTIYDEIRQLMPNHYFNINVGSVNRYWPYSVLMPQSYQQVAERCSAMIKGYIESIASRYEIMIPITAGKESRMLAAGSRELKDRVYYYINKEASFSKYHQDLLIPRNLFRKLNIDFHILDIYDEIDKDFRSVYFDNNPYASEFFLPHIFNYYQHFSEKVNLPGNIASSGCEFCNLKEEEVTPESLAKKFRLIEFEYALNYLQDWFKSCEHICKKYNIKKISLYYWEERMGNWGGQIQLEKDIAQEEFNPFNSRLLIKEFLTVDIQYRRKPTYILQKEIVRILWPELLDQPINPMIYRVMKKAMKMSRLDKYFNSSIA